ncbi:MAG: PAS domain-containing sensor histidine kinase [Deltaproteobacteria bacterium]|nr:PAS domain-containing sensor histidine kinase [Deltaproteobacteria bacterium]
MTQSDKNLTSILLESRDKLRDLIDSILEPVFTVDRGLRVIAVNKAFASRLNAHPREVIGRRCSESTCLFGNPFGICSEEGCLARSFFETGRPIRKYIEKKDAVGDTYCLEVSVSPVASEYGPPEQAVVVYRDVTPLKRLEEKARLHGDFLEEEVQRRTADLRRTQDELLLEKTRLEEAHNELIRLEKLKKDLIQMVVHDMKGPVGEVIGNLDLAKLEPLSERQLESIEMAESGCEDLLRMIMNLLDLSRMEEGRLQLNPASLDPEEVIGKIVSKFKTLLRLGGLRARIGVQGRDRVKADRVLLERILQNLLTNSINATPAGGEIAIMVSSLREGGIMRFDVRDTGLGIPESYRHLVFQKFAPASDDSDHRNSTGLGLNFCKMAVEAHGGTIWFSSREGEGTTFSFTLPVSGELQTRGRL